MQVDGHMDHSKPIATVASVEARLAALKVAIQGVGGRVEVADVKQHICVVKFRVCLGALKVVKYGCTEGKSQYNTFMISEQI